MKIKLLFEEIIIKKLNENKISLTKANRLLDMINEKSEIELINIVGHDWFDDVSNLIEGLVGNTGRGATIGAVAGGAAGALAAGSIGRPDLMKGAAIGGATIGGAAGGLGGAVAKRKIETKDLNEEDTTKEIDPVTQRRKYRNSIIGVAHGIPLGMLELKSDVNVMNYLLKKYPKAAKKFGAKSVKASSYAYAKAGIKGGIEGAILWGAYRLARSIFDSCSSKCGTFKFNDRDRQMCLNKCKERQYQRMMENIKK